MPWTPNKTHKFFPAGVPPTVVFVAYKKEWRVLQARCVLSRHATEAEANEAARKLIEGETA